MYVVKRTRVDFEDRRWLHGKVRYLKAHCVRKGGQLQWVQSFDCVLSRAIYNTFYNKKKYRMHRCWTDTKLCTERSLSVWFDES